MIQSFIRWVLINYYTYRYNREHKKIARAVRKFIAAPRDEKWYWREVSLAAIRERTKMFNKICEVNNVH